MLKSGRERDFFFDTVTKWWYLEERSIYFEHVASSNTEAICHKMILLEGFTKEPYLRKIKYLLIHRLLYMHCKFPSQIRANLFSWKDKALLCKVRPPLRAHMRTEIAQVRTTCTRATSDLPGRARVCTRRSRSPCP